MNKIKMLVLTALAAGTVVIGGLATAPSAHAERNALTSTLCAEIAKKWAYAGDTADLFAKYFGTDNYYYEYWNNKAADYAEQYSLWDC
jgi:hypothetical protein